MTKRLQVLLNEAEYFEIRQEAERKGISIFRVGSPIPQDCQGVEAEKVLTKLRALADAVSHDFPTGDVREMLVDIESGRALTSNS